MLEVRSQDPHQSVRALERTIVVEGVPFRPSLIATSLPGELHQGSLPPRGRALHDAGIDVVVLCAMEYQLPRKHFPGVEVIHCSLDDACPSAFEIAAAHKISKVVAKRLAGGDRVLVTCRMGLNRSGWVSALALSRLGYSSADAVERVRSRRVVQLGGRSQCALFNQHFVADILRRERS